MNQSYISKQEIIKNYRLICAKEPNNIENWLNLGRCLIDVQQYNEAEEALTHLFYSGQFFSFKKGFPRIRLKSLFFYKRNRLLYAKAYTDLAMISVHQGNLAEAERLLIMAMKVFEKNNSDYEYARASNLLGLVYRLAGAFESAEEAHYRAKEIAKINDWQPLLADTLGNLGMVYEGKERFIQAIECHQESLEIYRLQENSLFEQGCGLRQLGLCSLRQMNFDIALDYFVKAKDVFNQDDNPLFLARVLNDIALVYQHSEQLENALEYSKQALEIVVNTDDIYEIASTKLLQATIIMDMDLINVDVELLLNEAIDSFKSIDKLLEFANASATLGLYYLRQKKWDKAESFFKDSLRIEERLHRSLGAASDCSNLGLIAKNTGRLDKACEYWSKAVFFFQESGDTESVKLFENEIAVIEGLEASLPLAK